MEDVEKRILLWAPHIVAKVQGVIEHKQSVHIRFTEYRQVKLNLIDGRAVLDRQMKVHAHDISANQLQEALLDLHEIRVQALALDVGEPEVGSLNKGT